MIPYFFIYIIKLFLDFLTWGLGLAGFFVPTWLNAGIAQILQGGAFAQAFLPLYATPGMTGLAGQMGIMNAFGFLLILMAAAITIKIVLKGVMLAIGLIPWNTTGATDAINPDR